jgi:hypothetical protein
VPTPNRAAGLPARAGGWTRSFAVVDSNGRDKTSLSGRRSAHQRFQLASTEELAVFGTNLTNEYYLNSGFFHSLWDIDFATVGRPREVGVELKIRFD